MVRRKTLSAACSFLPVGAKGKGIEFTSVQVECQRDRSVLQLSDILAAVPLNDMPHAVVGNGVAIISGEAPG